MTIHSLNPVQLVKHPPSASRPSKSRFRTAAATRTDSIVVKLHLNLWIILSYTPVNLFTRWLSEHILFAHCVGVLVLVLLFRSLNKSAAVWQEHIVKIECDLKSNRIDGKNWYFGTYSLKPGEEPFKPPIDVCTLEPVVILRVSRHNTYCTVDAQRLIGMFYLRLVMQLKHRIKTFYAKGMNKYMYSLLWIMYCGSKKQKNVSWLASQTNQSWQAALTSFGALLLVSACRRVV